MTTRSESLLHAIKELDWSRPLIRWGEDHRALLRADSDAYYSRLYGLTRKQLRYILDRW